MAELVEDERGPSAPTHKRAWLPPAIVRAQPAFEHAILACTGRPSGSAFCNAAKPPKGNCVTNCVNNS